MMPRNLLRLSAAANRSAALWDYAFVAKQLEGLEGLPLGELRMKDSAKKIDKQTRALIDWAKANGIKINLPEGWRA